MNFINSIIYGIAFAFIPYDKIIIIPCLIIWVILVNMKDIFLKKGLFTDVTSPYLIYLENLKSQSNVPNHPWLNYLGMALLIDGTIAILVYLIAIYFMK